MDMDSALRKGLLEAMERTFGEDERRVAHTRQVLRYAEEMLRTETADSGVVVAAAILHDIGIQEAERRHGSAAGRNQEIEGPPMARAILESLGADETLVSHVCRIVGSHHSANDIDTPEFRIVWDADWLANLAREREQMDPDEYARLVREVFRTGTGRQLARRDLA